MEALIERFPALRVLLPLLTGIAIAILFARAAAHFSYTPDDTYIYLRTAFNLASGEGMSFNPGGSSYSVTGPLWALLIGAGSWMGLDPYIVAKGLDLTFAGLSVLALQLLVFTATGDRVFSVLAALMLAGDAWLLRWAGSGMETSLALLLTCVALAARRESHNAHPILVTSVAPAALLAKVFGNGPPVMTVAAIHQDPTIALTIAAGHAQRRRWARHGP